jgi:hypothetical protein
VPDWVLSLGPMVRSYHISSIAGIGRAFWVVSCGNRAICCFTVRWFPASSVLAGCCMMQWKSNDTCR